MDTIMIIAGGNWQIPLVKKCKELGYIVINSNLYENSPAFNYSDYFEVADILDIEKNMEIAEKYKPDAILTDQSDIAVRTVAILNENIGLKGIGIEVAENFTNKYKMRMLTKAMGLPTPEFILCESIYDLEEFLERIGKIVIKPLNSQSSRGVFTIDSKMSKENIRNKFIETQSQNFGNKFIIAEEFIEGTEFTVDGIKTNNQYINLAISEKIRFSENSNVASSLFFSHKNPKYDYDKLREVNERIVKEFGLLFGLTHGEYIFSKGEFYLVEIAARGGGTNISSHIVPIMSGIDNMEFLIKMALNKLDVSKEVIINEDYFNRCCTLQFFKFEEGKVKNILGTEILSQNSNIIDYGFNIGAGDYINNPTDDSKRSGYFIAFEDDEDKLKILISDVLQSVRVEYE